MCENNMAHAYSISLKSLWFLAGYNLAKDPQIRGFPSRFKGSIWLCTIFLEDVPTILLWHLYLIKSFEILLKTIKSKKIGV